MVNKRFNFLLSCAACLAAVQAGALVVCIGIMIFDSGPLAVIEGLGVWVSAQPFVLFVALCMMPIGALLRMFLGLNFENPRPVALVTGAVVGAILALLFAAAVTATWRDLQSILPLGSLAGLTGGWVWWRVERRWLSTEAEAHQP